MAVTFLAGEKISLRPLERSDVDALLPWVNDPEVTRTLIIWRPMNREAELEFLDRTAKSEQDVVLGIVVKATGRLIGAAGLNLLDTRVRQCQFGIFIGDAAERGKGYGTEATRLLTDFAFATLNLNRVWLHVTTENAAGIKAYERVGYRREGILRQAHYKEGRYVDLVTMAILRDEWAAGQ
jgi:RimJ/RimL family protein N-acetyltransferase